MTEKIKNGDYVLTSNPTGLECVEYIEELLQEICVCLTAKRGRFYPNKNFGSLINSVSQSPKDKYIVAFASQALAHIDGVVVKSAVTDSENINLYLTINNEQRQVQIKNVYDI